MYSGANSPEPGLVKLTKIYLKELSGSWDSTTHFMLIYLKDTIASCAKYTEHLVLEKCIKFTVDKLRLRLHHFIPNKRKQ